MSDRVANLNVTCLSPDETVGLAGRLASLLRPGDCLLLDGPVGAGKTHFARALIQTLMDVPEDVPSPTYTLVQTYETRAGEVWHADLYRLTGPFEIEELGLSAAFDTSICLVEWPDRLGDIAPDTALNITLEPLDDNDTARQVHLSGPSDIWRERLDALVPPANRDEQIDRFLQETPWANWPRRLLAGDASNRRYERLSNPSGEAPVVLMDAPLDKGESIAPFMSIAAYLSSAGFSAPAILAADERNGFLVLEDLGDDLFSRVIEQEPAREDTLYAAATDLLVALHKQDPPALNRLDPTALTDLAILVYDTYRTAITGDHAADRQRDFRTRFHSLMEDTVGGVQDVLILRDFHAENLIWLPDRTGVQRVGLLDFQDAVAGHPAYDLVSLLQDARRDVHPEIETRMIDRYLKATDLDEATFRHAYVALGVQRNLRILAVFARLAKERGKPQYIALIPRVWRHVTRGLQHPVLAPIADLVLADIPEPTPANLAKLTPSCPAPAPVP